SVTAAFKLYQSTTLVDSNTQTLTATGTFSWTKTGLTAGTGYTYTVTFDNTVAAVVTAPQGFSTSSTLSILPQVVSDAASVALGSASALGFKAASQNPNNVAYYVSWDGGATELRFPSTGYVAWDQQVNATTTYAFSGSHGVQVRLTDTSGARSGAVTATATITGAGPVTGFVGTSQLDTVTLSATKGTWGLSGGSMRFWLQDTVTHASLTPSSWFTNPSSTTPSAWTSGTLDRSRTYQAWVELSASDGTGWTQSWTTPVANQLSVQTNRVPTLTPGVLPAKVNYLDVVRFNVTYKDAEGDAPASPPTLTVNGATYAMAPPVSPDYRAGAEYHAYVAPGDLPQGRAHVPAYQVSDQYSRSTSALGAGVFVNKEYSVNLDFAGDQVGTVPQGMVFGTESLNYWRVADTESASLPGRVALGHHGKALWFASARGTYQDPAGGAPMGTMTLLPIDLRQITHPSLSFSSYYETEDLGTTRDRKLVEVKTTGSWQTLAQVSGYEGGFGAWRSQHVDLSAYAGQTVQIRFRFDAVDDVGNNHLGWLVDDVSIGHDADTDTLPDVLERTRHDVLVANQPAPILVPGNQNATSYVRRLVRPAADSFLLEALLSSAQPTALTVTVGVTPSLDDNQQHSFVLYSNGVDHADCVTTADNGIEAFQREAVVEKGDGLDIRIDLEKCAANLPGIPQSVFSTGRNWFLNLQVPASAGPSWIDMLRIVTSGHTDRGLNDTNYDSDSDGQQVNYGRDALGHDADQDGIPNLIDPDDTIPSWQPALQVHSNDYTKRMEVSLQDLAVPLAMVKVQARFNSTDQTRDLSSTYQEGATWVVNPTQYTQFPDALIVHWQDVYGTKGTVTYYMGPQDTEVFVPKVIVAETTDQASGQTITMQASLNSPAQQRGTIVIGTATLAATTYGGRQSQGQLMEVIGIPLIAARDVGNFVAATAQTVVATVTAFFGWLFQQVVTLVTSVVTTVVEAVDNLVNSFRFVVQVTKAFGQVTEQELRKVMEEGKAYLDDAGNVILITVANNKYIIAIGKGVGDGIVFVWEVVTWVPEGLAGSYDQLWTGIGYGSDCGAQVINGTDGATNPIDELDTSCWIHDECLIDRKDRETIPPFSRDPQAKRCNQQLVDNASASDCHLAVGSRIRIPLPEEQTWDDLRSHHRYRLPHDTRPLYVQPTADPGPITHCTANRPAIISLFSIGLVVANVPPPKPVVIG
ncbi:MAG: hypothetical protein LC623_08330, partial [Halobacteriales archaeon]|nr:hypothetical protein [Halobacteriales archaeon]